MSSNVARIEPKDAALAAHAATTGDLANLTPEQRTALYGSVCSSMGLNPLSRPFEYIKLNNKLTLYATRTATDQLRKINGVSITSIDQAIDDGVLVVTVEARDATGRTDMEIGAVTVAGLKGEALANARMKAITKAKRRVTLSISGLGWLDETEVNTVPSAEPVHVDTVTGEIHEPVQIRNASQDRVTAPPSRETPASGQSDEAEWQRANRRLHALVGHDPLHGFAQSKGVASWKEVPAAAAVALLNILEPNGPDAPPNQEQVDKFIAKYLPAQPQLVDAPEAVDVTRYGQ